MRRGVPLWALVAALLVPGSVSAQAPHSAAAPAPAPTQAPTQDLLQGQNRDQPIQIEAATLEVRNKNKMATFSGDVQVVQGDTTIKCPTLVVFYGPEEKPNASAAQPAANSPPETGTGQKQNIRRIEARGGVTVTSKDQTATGDLGIYDLKAKLITLTGNVVVTQGQNVMHGDRVVVDMVTGNARVESAETAPGRVRALILPSKGANGSPSNVMSFGPPRRPN